MNARFVIPGKRRLPLLLVLGDVPVLSDVKPDRPNILFLMGDDWSWPHASALDDPVVETPTNSAM